MEIKLNMVYFVVKEELFFFKFEGLFLLQRKNGVSINFMYVNEKSCVGFVLFLFVCFKEDFI